MVTPQRCSALQIFPCERDSLCTGIAQPRSVWSGHSPAAHFQSPEKICIPGRGQAAVGSNFCRRMKRGAAVGWPRKGWRAATGSSLEQEVQEEKWPRKSFLGSFHGHLQCAKPSWDTRPQPHVQTSFKSSPGSADPGCNT